MLRSIHDGFISFLKDEKLTKNDLVQNDNQKETKKNWKRRVNKILN